ncbi:hypothetical protein Tco_0150622 [Tanacetum coccineum]
MPGSKMVSSLPKEKNEEMKFKSETRVGMVQTHLLIPWFHGGRGIDGKLMVQVVTDIHKRTKTKPKGHNRARDWKSGKPVSTRPILSRRSTWLPLTSFSDTLAIPRNPIGCKDVEYDLRAQMMDLEFLVNQGLRLKLKNAPHGLEPFLMCYK